MESVAHKAIVAGALEPGAELCLGTCRAGVTLVARRHAWIYGPDSPTQFKPVEVSQVVRGEVDFDNVRVELFTRVPLAYVRLI